jgi:quinol-cytochrome oxidoreductase complex cytochrome b subunit
MYSITQSFPLPFYLHLVYVKVIDFQSHRHFVLLLLFVHPFRIFFILPFGLHRLLVRPQERPFHFYLRIILLLGAFRGLCGV